MFERENGAGYGEQRLVGATEGAEAGGKVEKEEETGKTQVGRVMEERMGTATVCEEGMATVREEVTAKVPEEVTAKVGGGAKPKA